MEINVWLRTLPGNIALKKKKKNAGAGELQGQRLRVDTS